MNQLLNPVQAGISDHRPPARRFAVLGRPLQTAALGLQELDSLTSERGATSNPLDLSDSQLNEGVVKGERCGLFSVVCGARHAVETSDEIRPVLHDTNCVEPYRAFLTYELMLWACSCSQLMQLGSLPVCWILTSA